MCQLTRMQPSISCTSSLAPNPLEASLLRRKKRLHSKFASYARMYRLPWYLFCFLTISSAKHGSDKSTLPDGIANFFYKPSTGNSNLRRHLYNLHAEEYDKAVVQYKWPVKLSTESRDASTQNAHNQCGREVPSFSPAAFLEHLVRFIVADDQVSPDDLVFFHTLTNPQSIRVVECPEFRQLCMVLCRTLIDADIPCHNKMREATISWWWDSFEQLKLNLSVCIPILSFHFIDCLWL